jgi:uncharacterized membrane protein
MQRALMLAHHHGPDLQMPHRLSSSLGQPVEQLAHLTTELTERRMALVVLLSSLHGFFAREARNSAQGGTPRSTRFYRIINELPTVILVLVVFLVVLKPF